MCFEQLAESNAHGELLLRDGGLCRYHLRRDGQLTIHEILSQRPGVGSAILDSLTGVAGARWIAAKCPADLPSNAWYARHGFTCVRREATRSGRLLNVWWYWL